MSEVSFNGAITLNHRYRITAAQREVAFADPDTQLGAYTDFFSWETANGGKLQDNVHFNANGLLAHAQQWKEILLNIVPQTTLNGDFESSYDPTLTETPPLADGAQNVIDTNLASTKPPTVGGPIVPNHWRVTQALDDAVPADGTFGLINPDNSTYANTVDTSNSGQAPSMDGRHIAFLADGTAGNSFLQTTRTLLKPNRKYTLITAIGIRDNAETFGEAKLEILADGAVIASATFTEADLNNVQGGNAKGKLTLARTSIIIGDTVTPSTQHLGIRITKTTGAGTYIDFDNVQLIEADPVTYNEWRIQNWGSNTAPDSAPNDDPDNDGKSNAVEYALDSSPLDPTSDPLLFDGAKLSLTLRKSEVSNATYTIEQSTTLAGNSWSPISNTLKEIISTSGDLETIEITKPSGWKDGPEDKVFLRLSVEIP